MKSSLFGSFRLLATHRALLWCALALLLAGCVTQEQVATIVAQSNASIVTGQLGDWPAASGGKADSGWEQANERIEAFVAAHPAQPAITAPLRVRQALLLLANGQISLGQAAFDAANESDLRTDRDRALKQNAAHLVWWFAHSTSSTWPATDQANARKALESLAESQGNLIGSPEIRDYLAEMRAWIGLAAAKQTANTDAARTRLIDALDVYGRTFSEHDLEVVNNGAEQLPDLRALTTDVRRRVRGRAVLDAARQFNQSNGLNAHPANATFDRLINRS